MAKSDAKKESIKRPDSAAGRLKEIYELAVLKKDFKIALEIHRELVALEKSAAGPATEKNYGGAEAELEAVRRHLLPLDLATKETPAGELARLAVQRIVELTSGENRK